MKKIRGMVRRWFIRHDCYHGLPLAGFMILYMIIFHILEVVPRSWYLAITTPLDRWIPFVEQFVVAYYSWFGFVAFGILYLYFKDRKAFDELQTFLMIGMSVFLIVSIVLPNRQSLRLLEMPRDNFFTRWVAFLWKSDTPTNVWPSIHVYNSTVIAIVFWRSNRRPWYRWLMLPWTVLIILSTVFIKQHSFFDLVTAFALVVCSCVYVYVYGHVWHFEKYDERWEKKPYWDDGRPYEAAE